MTIRIISREPSAGPADGAAYLVLYFTVSLYLTLFPQQLPLR
jgi:hypothetical protein